MILCFQLTMPNVGSWNGKWTGADRPHFRTRTVDKPTAVQLLREKTFHYNFGDGWSANVTVTTISSAQRRKFDRMTAGFCGYDWMIDSIISHGSIMTRKQIDELNKQTHGL